MAFAVGDVEPSVFHMVDEPVFFVDAAAVFSLQVAGEGFGFSDAFHTAVPFNRPLIAAVHGIIFLKSQNQ